MTAGESSTEIDAITPFWVGQYSTPTVGQFSMPIYTKETLLYIDGERIDCIKAVPTVIHNGIDRIKFGTWYKKNQAYRGEIDNFLILDANTP